MGIDALLETMCKLRDLHAGLLELAEAKTPVLVRNDVDELNAIVNKESKLMRSITDLDQQRVQAISEYLLTRGYNPNPRITISDLIRIIFKAEDKQALLEAQTALMNLLEELKTRNALNQQLVEQSLAFIDYTLDLVLGAPEDGMMYQNPMNNKNGNRLGVFDTKA